MLEVFVRSKSGSEKKYSFTSFSVMLGRAAGNDIQLEEGGVSRHHARLSVEGTDVMVQDLGSTNGTFVGSKKIEKVALNQKDQLIIGDYVLTTKFVPDEKVEDRPASPPPAAAKPVEKAPPAEERPKPAAAPVEAPKKEPAEKRPASAKAAEPGRKTAGTDENEFYWQSLRSFLAPVWDYVTDDSVSEIVMNGHDQIYIERKGKMMKVDAAFTPDQLNAAVLNIAQYVGRRVSADEPYLDARLPDGSRVAVLLPPCSRKGTAVSIRKFSKEKLTVERLISFGSLSPDMVTLLKACVALRKNIIVSGGTSSGKTSLLNVVSGLIPDDERILTIEDSAELQLRQEHVVPMETKPPDKKGRGEITIRDLVRASLRMRPDRIVVGEIRGGEAIDLLQAMNTGHSGSMATVHASSPVQALTRLETLALFSGLEIPVRALREQVSTAIDIIIQAARLPDHSRKVTHISEVASLAEDGSYRTQDIFRFSRSGMKDGKIEGSYIWTGHRPKFIEEMELAGLSDALALFEGRAPAA